MQNSTIYEAALDAGKMPEFNVLQLQSIKKKKKSETKD